MKTCFEEWRVSWQNISLPGVMLFSSLGGLLVATEVNEANKRTVQMGWVFLYKLAYSWGKDIANWCDHAWWNKSNWSQSRSLKTNFQFKYCWWQEFAVQSSQKNISSLLTESKIWEVQSDLNSSSLPKGQHLENASLVKEPDDNNETHSFEGKRRSAKSAYARIDTIRLCPLVEGWTGNFLRLQLAWKGFQGQPHAHQQGESWELEAKLGLSVLFPKAAEKVSAINSLMFGFVRSSSWKGTI